MKILKIAAIIISVLIIGFLSVGLINPSFQFSSSVLVNTSPQNCWTIYHDTTRMKNWLPGFKSLKLTSGQYMQAGSEYELILKQDEVYVMSERLKEIAEPATVTYELNNDVMRSEYTYSFTPEGEGSKIESTYQITGNNLFWKSMLFFTRSYIHSGTKEQLTLLKKEIEKK